MPEISVADKKSKDALPPLYTPNNIALFFTLGNENR